MQLGSGHIAKAMRENPPMSRAEEVEVARRARNGDKAARDRLVLCNLGFALGMASKYATTGVPTDDLGQYAIEGLLRAAKTFKPDSGNRFTTYAGDWVRSFLQRGIGLKEQGIRKGSQKLKAGLGHITVAVVALDATEAPQIASDLPSQAERHEREEHRTLIARRLASMRLPDRERDIVQSRFMGDEPESMTTIGQRHGICRERVRQIEERLRAQLREAMQDLAA